MLLSDAFCVHSEPRLYELNSTYSAAYDDSAFALYFVTWTVAHTLKHLAQLYRKKEEKDKGCK